MSQGRDRDTISGLIWSQLEASQRGKMTKWTVCDDPRGFTARRFEIGRGVTTPTEDTLMGELEHLRETFERAGFVRIMRDEGDEAQIVETWI